LGKSVAIATKAKNRKETMCLKLDRAGGKKIILPALITKAQKNPKVKLS